MKSIDCPCCGNGTYTHGSAIYDYYSCGHAYQKPLASEKGKMVSYRSPYPPYCNKYEVKG